MKKTVIAAAIGECVHVAGITNFLKLAEDAGWNTIFLGPAVPINEIIASARKEKADLVGVSYRLTAETGERLLGEFAEAADEMKSSGVRFAFGGIPDIARKARAMGFFEKVFDGSEPTEEVIAYLKGESVKDGEQIHYPDSTIDRINWKKSISAASPPFRTAIHGRYIKGSGKDSQCPLPGCNLAGHRSGRTGEFLPP